MSRPGRTDREVFARTTANRVLIADFLDGLDDRQWRTPTLCEGWDVHTMAAHLLQPMVIGFPRFVLTAIRYAGDTDRTVDHVTRGLARRSRPEILHLLRQHAGDEVAPARVGPLGPFAETCLHLRDVARPLGSGVDVPVEHWTMLLDYLSAPGAAPALVPTTRLQGLRFVGVDADWSTGSGPEVTGTVEALGMAMSGRRHALGDLVGPGVGVLRGRLEGSTP